MDPLEAGIVSGQQTLCSTSAAEAAPNTDVNSTGPTLSRIASLGKKLVGGGHHLRKTWSGHIKMDSEEVCNGASLSRASSASLSFSYSFTGFTALPEDIASDPRALNDNDNGNTII